MNDTKTAGSQAQDLFQSMKDTIAAGGKRFGIWGCDRIGLELLSLLTWSGLSSHVACFISETGEANGIANGMRVVKPENVADLSLDALVITADAEKEERLTVLARFYDGNLTCGYPQVLVAGISHFDFSDPVFAEIVRSCAVKSKAGGYQNMLVHLYQALKSVALRHLHGDVAEFGVFQGGTTVFMAKVLAHFGHAGQVYGFDTFAGFPPRGSLLDLYRDSKCEFADYDAVLRYCAPHNINLVRGNIAETHKRLEDKDLLLSFFDTDNYSAARQAVALCARRTVVGGFIAFDHYFSPNWINTIGERIAAREVLENAAWWNLYGTGVFMRLR